MTLIKREPRPQGSTFLSIKYRESEEPKQDLQNLHRHLITIYTTSGFRWNNTPVSIPKLSQILNIPQSEIMNHVSQTANHIGSLASPENIENTIQSLITLSTSFALEDRGAILNQLQLLQRAQGDTYKPFISSEVNKTLKLVLDSNKNIQDLYKTFFTSQNTNILIQNNEAHKNKENNENYLTPDTILELLDKEQPLTNKASHSLPPSHKDSNNANQDLQSLPESNIGPDKESETSKLADKLFKDYGIAALESVRENRSGSKALLAREPVSQGDTEPPSYRDEKPGGHEDGGFKRRNMDIEDTDELP